MRLLPSIVVACSLLAAAVTVHAALPDVPDDAKKIQPLKVGAKAPAFTVHTAQNQPFKFDPDHLARPVLFIFYRGGWCPYCNLHLGNLSKIEQPLRDLGYDIYFLSADRPELLYSSLKDPTIKYTLLSDSKLDAARAFGIAFRVSAVTNTLYKVANINLEKASGETHHMLPVPAAFIIDQQGVIRFAHANPDYRVRISNDELLAAAKANAH